MERLKLRVEVLLLVTAVSEGVQSNAVLVVRRQIPKLNSVPALYDAGRSQGDHLVLEALRADWLLHVVDLQVSDGEGLSVNEQVCVVAGQLVQVEVDYRVSQVVVSLLQGQLEVVLNFTDQFTALSGLLFRQNYCRLELFVDN